MPSDIYFPAEIPNVKLSAVQDIFTSRVRSYE